MKIRELVLCGCSIFLETIEGNRELPKIQIHFSTVEASYVVDGLFTSSGLRGFLEVKEYHTMNRLSSIVAAFFDQSTRHERTTLLKKIHKGHSEILFDVIGAKRQWSRTEKELKVLKKIVTAFKRMLVNSFSEHCNL